MIEPTPTPTPSLPIVEIILPVEPPEPEPTSSTIQPVAPVVDELAYTGPLDVIAASLGALVLLYAGLALLGRRSHDSETGA